jgi:hypothetical protein
VASLFFAQGLAVNQPEITETFGAAEAVRKGNIIRLCDQNVTGRYFGACEGIPTRALTSPVRTLTSTSSACLMMGRPRRVILTFPRAVTSPVLELWSACSDRRITPLPRAISTLPFKCVTAPPAPSTPPPPNAYAADMPFTRGIHVRVSDSIRSL